MAENTGAGEPKGKVDLAKYFQSVAESGQPYDPQMLLYQLDRDKRAGKYDVVFDPVTAKEAYKADPRFKNYSEADIDADIATLDGLHKQIGQGGFKRYYNPPTNAVEAAGVRPTPGSTRATGYQDPYSYFGTDGKFRPFGGNEEQNAKDVGQFFDRSGELKKLTEKDFDTRQFELDHDSPTDADGNQLRRPILRELPYGETGYGKNIVSKYGTKLDERNPVAAVVSGLRNTIGKLVTPIESFYDITYGQESNRRLKTLYAAYEAFDLPASSVAARQWREKGELYPNNGGSLGDGGVFGAGLPGHAQIENEPLYKLMDLLEKDQQNIRNLASKGDQKAKVAVDMLDLYHGIRDRTGAERWLGTANRLYEVEKSRASYRAEQQGFLGGAESTAEFLGQLVGFMAPQGAAARGLATGVLKYGGEALVTRSIANQLGGVLTKRGMAAVATSASSIPSAQMGLDFYHGAREVGYDHGEAALMAGAAIPAIWASEAVLGTPYMMRGYLSAGGSKSLQEVIGKELLRTGKKENAVYGAMSVFNNWLKNGSKNVTSNTAKNILESFTKEAFQETTEEGFYAGIESIADAWTGKALYDKSRKGTDYSLSNRLMQSFVGGGIGGGIMGGVLGGRRQVQPNNENIASLVAQGRGGEIIKASTKMRQDGQLTDEELAVIKQDVAFSEGLIKDFNISDPDNLQAAVGGDSLTQEFAKRSMNVKALKDELATIEAETEKTPASEKRAAQIGQELQAHQTAIGEIESGARSLTMYKKAALGVSAMEGKAREFADPAAIDHVSQTFRQSQADTAARIDIVKETRPELAKALNKEVDSLVGIEPGSVVENVGKLKKAESLLREKGLLTSDDVALSIDGLEKLNTKLTDQLRDATIGESADPRFANIKEAVESGNMDFEDWVQDHAGSQLDLAPEGDLAGDAYRGIKTTEQLIASYDDALLPSEKELYGELDPREQLFKHLSSLPLNNGTRVPLSKLIDKFKGRTTANKADIDTLNVAISQLELAIHAKNAFTGPFKKVADRFLKGNEFGLKPGSEVHTALQEDSKVYDLATDLGETADERLGKLLSELKNEHARLTNLLDQRAELLSNIETADLSNRVSLINAYLLSFPEVSLVEGFSDTLNLLQDSNSGPDAAQAHILINRLEHLISQELVGNEDKSVDVLNKLKTLFLTKENAANLEYSNTQVLNSTDLLTRNSADLFTHDRSDPLLDHLRLPVMVNWISRLSRTPVGDVRLAYDKGVKASTPSDELPNIEQENMIMEVLSFLANPSESLTSKLGIKRNVPSLMTVTGEPGVGKTTMVKHIVSSFSELIGNDKLKVLVVSPGNENAQDVIKQVRSVGEHEVSSHSIDEISKLSEKEFDLVFIDEAHFMDAKKLEQLNVAMNKKGDGAILALGDPAQSSSIAEKNDIFPIERWGMRTLPLQTTFRHSNVEMIGFLDKVRSQIQTNVMYTVTYPVIRGGTRYDADGQRGVRLVNTADPVEVYDLYAEQLLQNKASGTYGNPMLIVTNEAQKKKAVAYLEGKEDLKEILSGTDVQKNVRIMESGVDSALGLQVDHVFVAIEASSLNEDFTRFFYTAVSRGKSAVTAMLPGGSTEFTSDIAEVTGDTNEIVVGRKKTLERSDAIARDLENRVAPFGPVRKKKAAPAQAPTQGPTQRTEDGVDSQKRTDANGRETIVTPIVKKNKSGTKVTFEVKRDGKEITGSGWSYDSVDEFLAAHPEVTEENDIDLLREDDRDIGITKIVVTEHHFDPKTGNSGISTLMITKNGAIAQKIRAKGPSKWDDVVAKKAAPKKRAPRKKKGPKKVPELNENNTFTVISGGSEDFTTYFSDWWAGGKPNQLPAMTGVAQYRNGYNGIGDYMNLNKEGNKEFQFQNALMKKVFSSPTSFKVTLVKQTNGQYFSDNGKVTEPGIEIHLSTTEESVKATQLLMNDLFKKFGIEPQDFTKMPHSRYTMIGVLAIRTYAGNSGYEFALNNLKELAFGKNSKWEDGQSIEQYQDLKLTDFVSGIENKKLTGLNKKRKGSFQQFLTEHTNKGFKVGDPVMVSASSDQALTLADGNRVASLMVPLTPFSGAEPVWVRLHSSQVDDAFYTEAIEDAGKPITSDSLNDFLGYDFLQWNRSELIKNDAFVVPGLEQFLEIRDGKYIGMKHHFGPENENKGWRADLLGALQILAVYNKGKSVSRFNRPIRISKDYTGDIGIYKINKDDFQYLNGFETVVGMPHFKVDLVAKAVEGDPTSKRSNTAQQFSQGFSVKGTEPLSQKDKAASIQSVRSYYSRVLGERFMNNQLGFESNLTDEVGRGLWGVMENYTIKLNEVQEGFVRDGVQRHEAFHYVFEHLLTPRSQKKLMDEERASMNASRSWEISDQDVKESMANKYDAKVPQTQTGLVARFIAWLKGVGQRWGIYRFRLDELLSAIETGHFSDNKIVSTEDIGPQYSVDEVTERKEEKLSELSNLDRNYLGKVFGTEAAASWVINMVSSRIVEESQYQSPSDSNLSLPLKSLQNTAGVLLKQFREDRPYITDPTYLDGEEKVHFDDLTFEQAAKIPTEEIGNYVIWKLGEQKVLDAVIKAILPNSRVTTVDYISAVDIAGELNSDEDALDMLSGMVHNSTANTDPFSTQSALSKMMLGSMKLIRSNVDGVSEEAGNTAGFSAAYMKSILFDAVQNMHMTGSDEDHAVALGRELITIYNQSKGTSRGDHAWSFYKRFLDAQGSYVSDGEVRRSYNYVVTNADHVLSLSGQSGQKNTLTRINLARRVLVNTIRSYTELTPRNTWLIQNNPGAYYKDEEDGRQTIEQRPDSYSHVKIDAIGSSTIRRDLNDAISSGFLLPEGRVSIDKEYRANWAVGLPNDPKTPRFRINESGVIASDGSVFLKATKNGFVMGDPDAITVADFFSAAGYPINPVAIQRLIAGGDQAFSVPKSLLADIIGNWSMSIHAGIQLAETGKADKSLFSTKRIVAYNKSVGGVQQDKSLSEDYGGDLYKPSSFFHLNDQLAKLENYSRTSSYTNRMMSPAGKSVYPINLTTNASSLLPAAKDGDYSSRAIENQLLQLAKGDPALLKNGVPLIPLTNKDHSLRIDTVHNLVGLRDNTDQSGVDVGKMTDQQFENSAWDIFAKEVVQTGGRSLSIAGTPNGNRNNVTLYGIKDPFGGSGQLFSIQTLEGGRKSVTFNAGKVIPWFEAEVEYRMNVSETSKNRLAYFFGIEEPVTFAELTAKLAEFNETGKDGSFREKVQSSGLILNLDYNLNGDTVLLGNGTVLSSSSLFNYETIPAYRKLTDEKSRIDFVRALFKPHIDYWKEKTGRREIPGGAFTSGLDMFSTDNSERDFSSDSVSQMEEGYFMASYFVNGWVDTLVLGPQEQYKNSQDRTKRSVGAEAPGMLPVKTKGGYTGAVRFAVISEPQAQDGSDWLDGQAYTMPWGHVMARNSFGGEEGPIKQGVNKMVYQNNAVYIKSSSAHISPTVYRKNVWLQEKVRQALLIPEELGLGQPLLEAWDIQIGEGSVTEYWNAAATVNKVADERGISSLVVHAIASPNSIKNGLCSVNPETNTGVMTSIEIDPLKMRMQTVLDRSLTKTEAPYFSQIAALLGVAPGSAEYVQRLYAYESALVDLHMKEVDENIANIKTDEKDPVRAQTDRVIKYLRGRGIEATAKQIGQVSNLLRENGAAINTPAVRSKIIQFLGNELGMKGINPKMNGQMFTQVSSFGLQTEDVFADPNAGAIEDASILSLRESMEQSVLKDQEQLAAHVQENGVEDGFVPEYIGSEQEANDNLQLQQLAETSKLAKEARTRVTRELKGPRVIGNKYESGEIMIPLLPQYIEKFNIRNPDADIESIKTDILVEFGQDGLDLFEKTLMVYISRTPASNISSGQWMKVVGFINDTGSSIYTPAGLNKLTGGDFDGDQLSVYFRSLESDESGIPYENNKDGFGENGITTKQGVHNGIMDLLWNYYQEGDNHKMIMESTGTSVLQGVVNELSSEYPEVYGLDALSSEYGTAGQALVSRRMALDGDKLIGIGASYMKSYAFLVSAISPASEGWKPEILDQNGSLVLSNISELLNGALDNTKLMILGILGINETNIGTIMADLMSGTPLKQALSKPRVNVNTLEQEVELQKQGRLLSQEELEDISFAISRLNPLFKLNVYNGSPKTSFENVSFTRKVETALNSPIDDFLENKEVSGNYRLLINPIQAERNRKAFVEKQTKADNLIDPRAVINALPNIKSFLAAVARQQKMLMDSFLPHRPVMNRIRQNLEERIGIDGFKSEYEYNMLQASMDEAMLSKYMNENKTDFTMQMKGRTYDLSTRKGQAEFQFAFPKYWKNIQAKVLALHGNDKRVKAFKKSTVFKEVKSIGGAYPKVELRDGKLMTSEPELGEQLRKDILDLPNIFDARLLGNGSSILQLLEKYALVTNGLSTAKNSLLKFIPNDTISAVGLMMDQEVMNNTESFSDFMDIWSDDALVLNEKLLKVKQFLSEKSWSESVRKVFIDGNKPYMRVISKDDPKVQKQRISGDSTLSYFPEEDNIIEDGAAWRNVDIDMFSSIKRGTGEMTINIGRFKGWKAGQILTLPNGESVAIKTVNNKELTAVIDVTGISEVTDSKDDEVPGTLYNKYSLSSDVLGRNEQGYYGVDNVDVAGNLTDVMSIMATRTIHPGHKSILTFLNEQQAIAERIGEMSFARGASNSLAEVGPFGTILVMPGLSPLQTEALAIHEATHIFTRHIFELPDGSLTPTERLFRDRIIDLYVEARKALPESDSYGLDSVLEFVAEVFSNNDFQNELRLVGQEKGKRSLWHQFINALRKLLGLDNVDNTLLDQVLNTTKEYIEHASATGRTFDFASGMGKLYRRGDATERGLHPEFKEIKDIRDITDRLLSDHTKAASYESQSDTTLASQIIQDSVDLRFKKQTVFGHEFVSEGMSHGQLVDYVKKNIVPIAKNKGSRITSGLLDILYSKDPVNEWGRVFVKDSPDGSGLDESYLERVLDQIGHEEGDNYLHLNDLKDGDKFAFGQTKVKELGFKYIPGFDGYNPLLKVRKSRTTGKYTVSLIDASSHSLNSRGDVGGHLLSNYMGGTATSLISAGVKGYTLKNDHAGVRRLMLTLQAMAFKKANPTVSFDRLKIISMNSKGFDHASVWLPDTLREVKLIRETPALFNELPDNLKEIFLDNSLYDGISYDQSILHHYRDFLLQQMGGDQNTPITLQEQQYVMDRMTDFLSSDEGTDRALKSALVNRQKMMERMLSKEILDEDQEYLLIAKTIAELDNRGRKGFNSNRDVSRFGRFGKNPHNNQSDLVQYSQRITERSVAKIHRHGMEFGKKTDLMHNRLTLAVGSELVNPEDLPERSTSSIGDIRLLDDGEKIFRRLIRYSPTGNSNSTLPRVYDPATGEVVRANLNMLHWDKNDPETADLLAKGELTPAELEYANSALDLIHDAYVRAFIHESEQIMEYRKPDGSFDAATAKGKAEAYVKKAYPRGWLPIIRKSSSQLLSQGKVGQALRGVFTESINEYSLFPQDHAHNEGGLNNHVLNRYLSEIEGKNPVSVAGGIARLKHKLGIGIATDGRLELEDAVLNSSPSQNLEDVLKALELSTFRKIIHENESIPVANSVMRILAASLNENSVDQKNNMGGLKDYNERMIYGVSGDVGANLPFGVNPAPVARMLMNLTSFTGVAWSWKVAFTSAAFNATGLLNHSIASSLANDGLAGVKEMRTAAALFTSKENRDKAEVLMQYYSTIEAQESDQLHNFKNTKTRKTWFSSFIMNFGNWYGDYKTRGMVLTAQMLKDGSWEAHSVDRAGNMTYDVKKDRRFYNEDGTTTENGPALMKKIKADLISEDIIGQDPDKPLKAGYTHVSSRKFKYIADKWIIGGMDPSQHANINHVWYGAMFTTFQKFLTDRIYNWNGRTIQSEFGGDYVVTTDPETGEKIANFEKREITSYMVALGSAILALKEVKNKGWKSFESMTKAERYALSRLSMDLSMFAIMYLAYASLGDDDEEKKERYMATGTRNQFAYSKRFINIFDQLSMDAFSGSVPGLIKDYGGVGSVIPAVSTAWRLINLPFNPEKAIRFVPGNQLITDVYELVDRTSK